MSVDVIFMVKKNSPIITLNSKKKKWITEINLCYHINPTVVEISC